MHFYARRVLRIDLGRLLATVEPPNLDWARLYIGGKGLLFRYLFDEGRPGADPLHPGNPLILATGPPASSA